MVYGAFDQAEGTHWTWRIPTISQGFCPLIQLLAVWLMPESPRWLISKGRVSSAPCDAIAEFEALLVTGQG